MDEIFFLRGMLRGHSDMVTSIAVPTDGLERIVSSSRDKSLILWNLDPLAMSADELVEEGEGEGEGETDLTPLGTPLHRLTGHSDYVQDVVLSSDSMSALSCSWDGELRLWDLSTGATTRRFVGHNKDVLSVAFSFDNHQIMSASRDCTFKLWNTLGECRCTIQETDARNDWEADAHNGLVSCVRFYPGVLTPVIVSGLWDGTIKVWNLTNCKLRHTLTGHSGYVNAVAVSPDGSLCASGGKYGVILLWDLAEGKHICSFDVGAIIHALCFCPNRYWLCVAIENSVQIWDLESKSILQALKPDQPPSGNHMLYCTSMNWSVDGNTFFTGYSDGTIRVWGVVIGGYDTLELMDLEARTDVKTGLSKDFIINNLKIHLHKVNGVSSDSGASSDDTCVICQGEYGAEDCIGTLDCGHMCHSDCIKQWLVLKNLCPICKKVALSRSRSEILDWREPQSESSKFKQN